MRMFFASHAIQAFVYFYIYLVRLYFHICFNKLNNLYVEIDLATFRGFEHKSFPLKFNDGSFKYQIHSIKVINLHFLK